MLPVVLVDALERPENCESEVSYPRTERIEPALGLNSNASNQNPCSILDVLNIGARWTDLGLWCEILPFSQRVSFDQRIKTAQMSYDRQLECYNVMIVSCVSLTCAAALLASIDGAGRLHDKPKEHRLRRRLRQCLQRLQNFEILRGDTLFARVKTQSSETSLKRLLKKLGNREDPTNHVGVLPLSRNCITFACVILSVVVMRFLEKARNKERGFSGKNKAENSTRTVLQ